MGSTSTLARPGRRMPTAVKIARYWLGAGPFAVDMDRPACFGCGQREAEWRHLERAHLIDRMCGGLDHEANLAPHGLRCELPRVA